MPATLSPLKAGSTFSYAGSCTLPAGTWTATCQVRVALSGELISQVTVTLGAAVSGISPLTLYAAASLTAAWPVGVHELDIRYADAGGQVVHTSTVSLPVVRSITRS